MLGRMLRSMAMATAAWAFVTFVPDLARYLRMRELSRPEPDGADEEPR